MTEIAILESDTLMLSVAREMDLANNATFLTLQAPPSPRVNIDDPSVRQSTVHRLQSGIHIQLVPKTDIIRISCESLDPKLSANIVNKIIEAYMQRSFQTRVESTKRVSDWLEGQLSDLKQNLESSQEQMLDLQKRVGILAFDPTHNQISSSLDDLSRAVNSAKIARIIAESRYRVLSGMDPDTIEGSIDMTPGTSPGELNSLRSQLAVLRSNYAQLTSEKGLGPRHPQAVALKAQMDEITKEMDAEQSRLVLQAKEVYVAARANEEQTTAALDAQKADAYKLRDDMVEYTLRQREFESNRTLYEGLLQRLRTAGVQAGLESLEIDIVDHALPPANARLQPQSTIIITNVIFALIGGIVVSFLLEALDTGLRSISEIESITELPSLAVIPRARRSSADEASSLSTAQRNISILTQSKSQFAESFRSLRTSLLLSNTGTSAQVHPLHQCYAIRRKDHRGEQPRLRHGSGHQPRSADRRRPAPAQYSPSLRPQRQAWSCHGANRRNHPGRHRPAHPGGSESGYSPPADPCRRSPLKCSVPRR